MKMKIIKKIDKHATTDACGSVYLITNKINNKKYVGITTRDYLERFEEHCKADSYIGKAIRKYGRTNFEVKIVDLATTRDELMEKEISWIEKLNTFEGNGYNLTRGGDGVDNLKKMDRVLSNKQLRFVDYVNEFNRKPFDVNNHKENVLMVLLNAVQIYLLCEFEFELKDSAKLISKFKPQYLKVIDDLNVIDLKEVYGLVSQKKSSLGVYLSHV